MKNDEGALLDCSDGDLAEYPREYLVFHASLEFEKARIRSIAKKIPLHFGSAKEAFADGCGAQSQTACEISMSAVAGTFSEGRYLSLPILPRRLQGDWIRSFYRISEESDYQPPRAMKRGASWYLEAEPRSLLLFEILKSKGVSSLRVQATRAALEGEDISFLSIPSLVHSSRAMLGSRPAK
jgi:hypothetical protein